MAAPKENDEMNRAMIASIIAAAAAGAAFAQPVQWRVEDGGNGHWYQIFSTGASLGWHQSQNLAMAQGGHLAAITSAAEWSFVQGVANQPIAWNGNHGPWLGGFQDRNAPDYSEPAGGWRWVTGEAFTFTAWWFRGPQPSNSCAGTPEDFLHVIDPQTLAWNDIGEPSTCWIQPVQAAVFEWSADCNADGLVDKGQILAGDLPDANNNGIPDWSVSIARQPVDQSVGVDQPVFFVVETVTTPSCTTPVAYRWQRRNPLVADETAADAWLDLQDGGGFLNTGTPSLTILRPTPALATGYRCRISGGCGCEGTVGGTAFTNTVNFGVACPADFNADGGIDFGDVEAFFERWENGC
jgi:hypothetical protein